MLILDAGTGIGEETWGHAGWSLLEFIRYWLDLDFHSALSCFGFSHSLKFWTLCTHGIRPLGLGTRLSSRRWAFHVEPPPLPGLNASLGPVVADIRASVVPVGGSLYSTGRWLALGSSRFSQHGVGGVVCVGFTLRETGFRPRSSVSLSHCELWWPVSCDVLVSILWDLYKERKNRVV